MKFNFKKVTKFLSVTFVATLVLTACGGSATTSGEKVLNIATLYPSNSLNHSTTSEATNFQIIGNMLEGLMSYDVNDTIVNANAESYELSSDNTVYTFKIREDANWENGTPVTAHDYIFSWTTLLTDPLSKYYKLAFDIVNAEEVHAGTKSPEELGVIALDDKTLEITLNAPRVYLLDLLAFPAFFPINEEFYNEHGDQYGTSAETILANGPFILTDYAGDAGYTLTKNPNYWDVNTVQLDAVVTRVVPEPSTHATLYDSGEIDRLQLNTDLYEQYKDSADYFEENEPTIFYLYLSAGNNGATTATKNEDLRLAVSYALDKTILTDRVLKNGSLPIDYIVPQNFDNLNGQTFREYSGQLNELKFDIATAQEYFEKAKASLSPEELKVTIMSSDSVAGKTLFENVQAQLKANLPGLEVEIKHTPSNLYYSTLQEFSTQSAQAGWGADFVDVATFFDIFHSEASQNYCKYNNPVFDDLITRAKAETDAKKRWDLFVQAELELVKDGQIIPLYQRGARTLVKPGVENLKLNVTTPDLSFKYVTKN